MEVAREQLPADLFLELLDALADSGLRARHALGRAREGAFFDDREKVFELQEIHRRRSLCYGGPVRQSKFP